MTRYRELMSIATGWEVELPLACRLDLELDCVGDPYPLLSAATADLAIHVLTQNVSSGRSLTVTDLDGNPIALSPQLSRPDRHPLAFLVKAYLDGQLVGRTRASVRAVADKSENLLGILRTLPVCLRQALAGNEGTMVVQRSGPPVPPPSQRRFSAVDWAVGLALGEPEVVITGTQHPIAWLRAPLPHTFWADPCLVQEKSGTWLFVEEFVRWRGLGRICALRVERGHVVQRQIVLQDEHHRALPRVWRDPIRGYLATTDSCEVPGSVFSFEAPGQPWKAVPGFHLPPYLADPQLYEDGGAWVVRGTNWLAGENQVHELYRSAQSLPVRWDRDDTGSFVDPRWARGAGRATSSGRAAQDCSRDYGACVYWMGADQTVAYASQSSGRSVQGEQLRGMHTLDWHRGMVVTDGWWISRAWLSPLWNRLELRHLRHCRMRTRPQSVSSR